MTEPALAFTSDPADIPLDVVLTWLAEESYWAKGRTRAAHQAAMAGSRNYGVLEDSSGRLLGYARVITDGVTFGWLCDVFVAQDARGLGVGKRLLSGILDHLEPLGLKRTALFTADAHGLYEQFGFRPLADADSWMMRWGTGFGPDA